MSKILPQLPKQSTNRTQRYINIVIGILAIIITLAGLSLSTQASLSYAAPGIYQSINFQGRLLNDDGTLVTDGTHSVVFSLYTTDSGGSNIWTETQSVTTTDGFFRVSLGSVNSIASVNFNQDAIYLGIKVGTDSEMTPRIRFHASPFAFEAEQVNGLSVTNNGGNILNIAANKTVAFGDSISFGTYSTNGGLLYANGGGTINQTAAGSDGQCLQSNGSGSPTWGSCDATNTVIGTGTAGQLTFWTDTDTISSDGGLVWDNVNKRLGINDTPTAALEVDGTSILYNDSEGDGLLVGTSSSSSSQYALSVTSGSGPYTILYARADGKIGFGTDTLTAGQWVFAKNFNSSANEFGLVIAASQSTGSASATVAQAVGLTISHTSGTQLNADGLQTLIRLTGNGGTTTNTYASNASITVGDGATATWIKNFAAKNTYEAGSTVGNSQGLYIQPTIESGASVSGHTGIFIEDANNSGTLTNQVGVNIDDLDAATNNTLLLIGQSSTVTGNNAIYSGSSYQSTLSGPLYISASQNGATQGESNQHIVLRTTNENTGAGPGIAFSTSSGTGNIGARIVFERTGTNSMGDLVFYTKPDTTAGDTTVEALRIADSGAIGINSATTFGWALEVNALNDADGAAWFEYNYSTSTTDVGVLSIRRQGSTAGTGGGMDFYMDDSGGANSPYAYLGAYIVDNTSGSEDGGLVFGTTNDGSVRSVQMRIGDAGNVAIGVDDTDLTAKLEVVGTQDPISNPSNSYEYTQILRNPTGSTGVSAGLGFSVTNTDHNIGAALIFVRTGGNSMGELQFYTKQNTSGGADPNWAMTLDDAGYIHVNLDPGTATEAVCHSGTDASTTNVKLFDCSGNPNADYAEMYPMASGIGFADVVSLGQQPVTTTDGQTITQLVKSTTPYDAKAIGIVSNNYSDFSSTGYNLNQTDNPMPVALNGRVPVKIASTSAPITPGDYLTTSTQPGKAAKAILAGSMIGRALQSWDPEHPTATIMVFVDNGQADPQAMIAGDVAVDPEPAEDLSLQTVNDLTVQGSLIVGGPVEFKGPAIFRAIAEFFDTVIFHKSVQFADHVQFGPDAAGTIKLAADQTTATVTFATPYSQTPVVNLSRTLPDFTAALYNQFKNTPLCQDLDETACHEAWKAQQLADNPIPVVTDRSTDGFSISLTNPATTDLYFSWSALAIGQAAAE